MTNPMCSVTHQSPLTLILEYVCCDFSRVEERVQWQSCDINVEWEKELMVEETHLQSVMS